MDKIVVYVDDASYAEQQLTPMLSGSIGGTDLTHWIVVACAPRMTHRISKWVSHSARENWRAKWSDKLFGAVVPMVTPLLTMLLLVGIGSYAGILTLAVATVVGLALEAALLGWRLRRHGMSLMPRWYGASRPRR